MYQFAELGAWRWVKSPLDMDAVGFQRNCFHAFGSVGSNLHSRASNTCTTSSSMSRGTRGATDDVSNSSDNASARMTAESSAGNSKADFSGWRHAGLPRRLRLCFAIHEEQCEWKCSRRLHALAQGGLSISGRAFQRRAEASKLTLRAVICRSPPRVTCRSALRAGTRKSLFATLLIECCGAACHGGTETCNASELAGAELAVAKPL